MKNWTWKQWTAFSIVAAFIIAEIVMCFINPVAAVNGFIGLALGILGTLAYNKIKKEKAETTE